MYPTHSRRGAVAADDFCEEDPVLKNSTLEKRLFSVVENLLFSICEFFKTGSSSQKLSAATAPRLLWQESKEERKKEKK